VSASAHQQRILTAILAVSLVALALWQGGVFVLAVLVAGKRPCGRGSSRTTMFRPGHGNYRPLRLTRAGPWSLGLLLASAPGRGSELSCALGCWAVRLLLCFLALRIFAALRPRPREGADFHDELILMAGLMYLPLMLQFCLSLSTPEIVLVLLSTAVSDTAAYYSGTYFGKTKIWPQVSPKKSWAGSIGGFIGCVAAVTAYGVSFGDAPVVLWVLLGALLNIAAQMGDFFESALKRKLCVKDSGTLLPGHGGLLDRIDSLLLALPCYALFIEVAPLFP
jgi:phosphatidate cytidylyltransferase